MTNRIFKSWSLLIMLVLGGMFALTAQTPGIPYQAYIIDTNGGYVPGEQIEVPLTNAQITLEFEIRNDKGEIEYIEQKTVTTDEFGMVSTIIGIDGTPVMGSFEDIDWNGMPKDLHIDIDFSGTGSQFQDHGQMPIVYIPGPGGGAIETTTKLVYNNDGSYTYNNEDGDGVSFSVPQHAAGDPNTLGTAGHMGDLFVDESTGELYMHGGTSWVPITSSGPTITTNTGGPTPTNPANPAGGDIYVDESTGDLYTYNSTTNTWESQSDVVSTDADNIIIEGTDGLAYLNDAALGLSTGTGAPTATSPANPTAGDIYVDESTGDVYTYDGTNWIPQPGVTTTTGTGIPTPTNPANPAGGDIYVDESTGDLYTYNSTTNTWESQSDVVSTDADNIIIEGTDGLAYLNDAALGLSTGTGAPTATSPANPTAGDIYVDESTGDVYTYDGTNWIPQPGVTTTTGTGIPTPTNPANPAGGDIYVDESTGDLYTYNSTTNTWENQSDETLTVLSVTTNDGPDGIAGTADDFDELTYEDENGDENVVDLSSLVSASETLTVLSVTTNDGPDGIAGTADDFDELVYQDEEGTENKVDLSTLVAASETLTVLSVATNAGPDGIAGNADDFDELVYQDEEGTENKVDLSTLVAASETLTVLSVTTNDGPDGTAGTADDFDELVYQDEEGTENKVDLSTLVAASETLTVLSVTTNDGPDGIAGTADDFDELVYQDEEGTENKVDLSTLVAASETLTVLSVTTNDGPDGIAGTADDFDELVYQDEEGTENKVDLSTLVAASETLTVLSVTTNDGPDGIAGTADDFDELVYQDEEGTENKVDLSTLVAASETLTVLSVTTNAGPDGIAGNADDFDELVYQDEEGTENKVDLSTLVAASETLTVLSVTTNAGPDGIAGNADDFDELVYQDEEGTENKVDLSTLVDGNQSYTSIVGNKPATTPATPTTASGSEINGDTITEIYDDYVVNYSFDGTTWTIVEYYKGLIKQHIARHTANAGDIDFTTPQTILDLDNIDVYRNGARIDFTQVNANTIKLDLGSLSGCFAGDEIRIVQLQ